MQPSTPTCLPRRSWRCCFSAASSRLWSPGTTSRWPPSGGRGVWGRGWGGQGYLSANRLGECITWSHAGLTAEGDNRVLMQKVSKELMTTVKPAEVKRFAALSKHPLALHPPGVGDHRGPQLPGRTDCPTAGEGEVPPALLVLKDGSGAEERAQGAEGGGGVPGVDDGGERPCSAHSTRLWRACGQWRHATGHQGCRP